MCSSPSQVEMSSHPLQLQLVQQSWEKPSSSSGPWTGPAGKPLHESGKVLRGLRPCPCSYLAQGQEGTGAFGPSAAFC